MLRQTDAGIWVLEDGPAPLDTTRLAALIEAFSRFFHEQPHAALWVPDAQIPEPEYRAELLLALKAAWHPVRELPDGFWVGPRQATPPD